MGDAVGEPLVDTQAAVVNVPYDGFGQQLSCRRWHVAGAGHFSLASLVGRGRMPGVT
jgi:hypothetical protein